LGDIKRSVDVGPPSLRAVPTLELKRVTREMEAVPARLAPLPAVQRPMRLLVIDDEPLLGQAIRRLLLDQAAVTPCHRPREALDLLLRGEPFEAILCDLQMPDLTGPELHARLVESRPELADRIGFMTAAAATAETAAFAAAQRARLLEKPFSRADLLGLLGSLTGGAFPPPPEPGANPRMERSGSPRRDSQEGPRLGDGRDAPASLAREEGELLDQLVAPLREDALR
jgi:CheY-like chemotaxis protein